MKLKTGLTLLTLSLLATVIFTTGSAHAATPPDSCFDFTAGTGTINDYYDNEDNNGANPACTREPDIPATIGGSPVLIIGTSAFQNNSLTSVTIPSSVTSIGDSAFNENQLTSITIPNSVTVISREAFSENQLTSITIPNSVTSIGSSAFNLNYIASISLGTSLTTIDEYAFANNQITTATLPNSLVTLMANVFTGQNPLGRDGYSAFLSGDPAQIQELLDSIFYTRLYTASSSNPNSLDDGIVLESTIGFDVNSDGDQNDSTGGHLINPAQASISYESSTGSSLRPTDVFTGTGLNDYLAVSNTTNDLSLYYRLGQAQSFSAPAIAGYTTPSAVSLTLSAANTPYGFVYAAVGGEASEGSGSDQGGELAETGVGQGVYIALATAILVITGAVQVSRLAGRRTTMSTKG
ncbi:leucine-rich repeat domain-containing protein [Patescibacteria group bacterium]|nr:MAG: leucine-rich repeat domain-containing protein [Patescibacteria group bacterium]